MDNPDAHSTEFSNVRTVCAETLTIMPIRNRSQTLFFICEVRRKSVAGNFLSCTKNIELTRGGFALTFSFALTKEAERPSREKPL